MSETRGGTYEITLIERMSGRQLRNIRYKLNSNENTVPLRDGAVAMFWDSAEAYADISIDDDFLIRLPTKLSSESR